MWTAVRIGIALASLAYSQVAAAQQAVILVRHADRDPDGADALTAGGRARAAALAEALKNAGVTLMVRSDTQRTRDTAEPLAKAKNLPEKVVDVGRDHVRAAAEAIRQAGAKGVVLYVGHSDTVPQLINKLGYRDEVTIGHDDYGDLFILVPRESGPTLLRLHFGVR